MSIKTANRDVKSLKPLAQEAFNLFMEECKKQGVKVFATEFHRSSQRQAYLYEQGRTRPGKIVTNTLNSNHSNAMAWDVAVSPPKALYDNAEIAKAGAIAMSLGIEWGGSWKKFVDRPHFQIDKNWKNPKNRTPKNMKSKFNLNGAPTELDGFLEDGKTYVVVRGLLEGLGISVGWDNTSKSVTVDGKPISFEKVIIDGKTYVVARPLLEQLGFRVGWENSSKTVTVTK